MFQNTGISLLLLACASACVGNDAPTSDQGNDELGIVAFRTEESPTSTSVIGVGASGDEIARLDLVHGRFALTGIFKDDYNTPEVDGRQLSVSARGQQLHWETAGFEPVLELPAHPGNQWALAAFIADDHVKAVLDRWQIGFERFQTSEDAYSYTSGSFRGQSPQTCDGLTSCGTALNGTINTCGGGAAADSAARVTQVSGTNCGLYASSYDQVLVSQCCPAGSGGQSGPWYAQKACPTTASNTTSCGTRTAGACKACPTYPVAAPGCTTSVGTTVGTCGANAVYPVNYGYGFNACMPSCVGSSSCYGDDGCGGTCWSYVTYTPVYALHQCLD